MANYTRIGPGVNAIMILHPVNDDARVLHDELDYQRKRLREVGDLAADDEGDAAELLSLALRELAILRRNAPAIATPPELPFVSAALSAKLYDGEAQLVTDVLSYLAKIPNAVAYKYHGDHYGTAGVPDIHVSWNRLSFWFETKAHRGRTSAKQDVELARLRRAAAFAGVARSVLDVRDAMTRASALPTNSDRE